MALPALTGVGRLTADPEVRVAASGTAVCKFNVAFNERRKNPNTGQYEDAGVCFLEVITFKQLAESCAESLTRADEVVVSGRLKTEQWDDKNGGGKRSKVVLIADSVGPNLAFATAKPQRLERQGGQPSGGSRPANDDPWSSEPPF